MDKDTTRSLTRILENIDNQSEAGNFARRHGQDCEESFCDCLNEFINQAGMSLPVLIERSGLNRNYFYSILNGHRKQPSRDRVIALCIGLGLTFSQAQRMLRAAGHKGLYPKDPRDVRITVALNSGVGKTIDVNDMLRDYDLELLEI